MSNNLTKKGLALGSIVALAVSALTVMPAQAAVGIDLTAKDGRSVYGMLSDKEFTFTANGNAEFPVGNATLLRVQVTNVDGAGSPTGFKINGNALTTSNDILLADAATNTATTLGATAGNKATFGLATSSAGTTSAMTSPLTFSMTATAAADAPKRYDVVVFADTNNNAVLDAGELSSPTRTVTFTNSANVSPAISITAATEGDTAASASFTLPNIAMDQLAATLFAGAFSYGDDTATAFTDASVRATQNATTFAYEVSVSGLAAPGLLKTKLLKFQPHYLAAGFAATGATEVAAGNRLGSASTAVIAARKAGSFGSGATATTSNDGAALATGTLDIDTLTNSSFSILVEARDTASFGDAAAKVVAGAPVTVTVTSAGLSSTKTLSVNGTVYTSSTALPGQGSVAKLALTTNASGQAQINLATVGYSAGNDVITLSIQVENLTAQTVTLDAEDAAYTVTSVDGSSVRATTSGSSVSVPVQVYDQFGGVPADKFDLRGIVTGGARTGTGSAVSTANAVATLTGGKATLSLPDNGSGTGTNSFSVQLYERLAGNTYGSATGTALTYVVHYKAAADLVVGDVAISTGTLTNGVYVVAGTQALNLNTPASYDSRGVLGTAPSFTGSSNVTISGVAKTAVSLTAPQVVVPGAQVTLTGAGMQFRNAAGTRWTTGSIVIYADASGNWSADVASNKVGKNTVTVSSGSAAGTVEFTVADASGNSATALAFSAPKSIKAGRTLVVGGTLTDKFGNVVQTTDATASAMTVSYDGPGYIISGSLPTSTDASGKFSFRVLLGVNETGPAITTVTYGGVNGVIGTGSDDATFTSATWVGPIANASAGANKGVVVVDIYRAKGQSYTVLVGGKVVASGVANKANYTTRVTGIKSGSRNVVVRLKGGTNFSGAISVK